jgi:hypothetical protein
MATRTTGASWLRECLIEEDLASELAASRARIRKCRYRRSAAYLTSGRGSDGLHRRGSQWGTRMPREFATRAHAEQRCAYDRATREQGGRPLSKTSPAEIESPHSGSFWRSHVYEDAQSLHLALA